MIGRLVKLLPLFLVALLVTSPASAVIINNSTGEGNTTAPDGDCGWSYVGVVNGCSCVYLGNGWVITASHVGSGTVNLNGVSYAAVSGSTHRLTTTYVNSKGSTTTGSADLIMFQLQTTPSLASLVIADSSYADGDSVVAIGNGKNRAADKTYWAADWTTTDASNAAHEGYAWLSSGAKRWGTNTLSGTSIATVDGSYGVTYCLHTTFDANGGDNEMQAARGDSGGGVFMQINGVWMLSGIILAVDGVDDKPTTLLSTAVYGDATYFADLRYYADQIQEVMAIPEPGTLALLAACAVGWLLWRRQNVRRRHGL